MKFFKPKPPWPLTIIKPDWQDETVFIIGTGPGVTPEMVNSIRGRGRVIAINYSVKLAPWADLLYAGDASFWKLFFELDLKQEGRRVCSPWNGVDHVVYPGYKDLDISDLERMMFTGEEGLDLKTPTALRTGKNSGYQAINLAVKLGAKKIILLGFDLRHHGNNKHHWFGGRGPYHTVPPYHLFIPKFETMTKDLKKAGVTVINCTPESALKTFPIIPLKEALGDIPL